LLNCVDCPVKKQMVKSFVKDVDCEVKNKAEVLIYTVNKTPPPLFFTGRKLRLLGIGIEATAQIGGFSPLLHFWTKIFAQNIS